MILIVRKSNGIISRCIRWLTGEEWSHIGYLSGGQVYHSDFYGVSKIPTKEFVKNATFKTYTIKTTVKQNEEMLDRAQLKLREGTNYDFPALFAFLFVFLLKKIGIRVKMPEINPRWMVCSEFMAYVIWDDPITLTPGQVLEKLEI